MDFLLSSLSLAGAVGRGRSLVHPSKEQESQFQARGSDGRTGEVWNGMKEGGGGGGGY